MRDMQKARRATSRELMTLNTTRVPDTDWTAQMDGEWWLVHEGPVADAEANMREFARIKMSTGRWAKRVGRSRQLRRRRHGQKIWVRFPLPTAEGEAR